MRHLGLLRYINKSELVTWFIQGSWVIWKPFALNSAPQKDLVFSDESKFLRKTELKDISQRITERVHGSL